ncbi:MAG: NUDIX hydrolase [Nanoarchaeota archaeon]|nr:NUDIX hydrolase [Nanoarchaeota archaeon]
MTLENHPLCYTICSAIITKGGEIGLKESDEGLSLLGGFVDWWPGFPKCIIERTISENGIDFSPSRINGIVQSRSLSGKWITNINVIGPATNIIEEKGVKWFKLEEVLSHEKDFRTPDTAALLRNIYTHSPFDLNFINTTAGRPAYPSPKVNYANTESYNLNDIIVVSSVVRYKEEGEDAKYALMVCGSKESSEGKLSLFGGKLAGAESIIKGTLRELFEEAGGFIGYPLGLVGAYINYRGRDKNGQGMYATNFSTLIRAPHTNIDLPSYIKGEVAKIEWYSIKELHKIPAESFRTIDTKEAILKADYKLRFGEKLVPLNAITEVESNI